MAATWPEVVPDLHLWQFQLLLPLLVHMERHKGVDSVLVEQREHLHNQLLDLTGWIIPGAVHAARRQGLHLADGCHFAIQCRSSSSARLRADTGRPLGWIARSGHCGNGCCSHLVFRLARAVAYRYRVVQPRAAHERDRFSRGETGFCETDVLLGYIVKIALRRWDQAIKLSTGGSSFCGVLTT